MLPEFRKIYTYTFSLERGVDGLHRHRTCDRSRRCCPLQRYYIELVRGIPIFSQLDTFSSCGDRLANPCNRQNTLAVFEGKIVARPLPLHASTRLDLGIVFTP